MLTYRNIPRDNPFKIEGKSSENKDWANFQCALKNFMKTFFFNFVFGKGL